MKKILLIGLLLTLTSITVFAQRSRNRDTTPPEPVPEAINLENLVYRVQGQSIVIIGPRATGYAEKLTLVIPAEIEGLPVTHIAGNAFSSRSTNAGGNHLVYNRLISVTIPDGVIEIGEGAFADCSELTSVTIGNSVTTIGNNAFRYTGLTSVTIPDSVTRIGDEAFANTTLTGVNNLTSVTIGNSVTEIGNSAFRNTMLTSVTIPDSVTRIGNEAFANTSLTSVTIGNSVTEIGNSAFRGTKLESVTIPNSVTRIGQEAFARCSELTSVTIGNGVTSIRADAFIGTSLTNITVPASVTSIGSRAFNISSLTSVTFEGTIPSSNFTETDTRRRTTTTINPFPTGNLLEAYLDESGGPGTYTRSPGGQVWRKQ